MLVLQGEQFHQVVLFKESPLLRIVQNSVSQELFEYLPMVHLLLYGSCCDKPVHGDLLLLSYSPGTFPCLHISGGIPVRIIDDHSVRPCQVDTEPSNPGCQDHNEVRGIRVEFID
uniref:Uncharacterized protein n=1 Tax=Cacopsylla melanoneura TaxID=428564 RepID=A0A8D8ST21_9HEMI